MSERAPIPVAALRMISPSALLALALQVFALQVQSQDLFDEATGGSWHASKYVTITNGFQTGSEISLWRHPVQEIAEIRVTVVRSFDADGLTPNAIAIKADDELQVFPCELVDRESYTSYTTYQTGNTANTYPSDVSFSYGVCETPYEFSDTLLEAEKIEVQISTSTKRLKHKTLSPKQIRKFKKLRQVD